MSGRRRHFVAALPNRRAFLRGAAGVTVGLPFLDFGEGTGGMLDLVRA